MLMKKLLLSLVLGCIQMLLPPLLISQTLYNSQNVDRTATSFFDGSQTFRALEYTVNQNPQSQKVCRLQTKPENGFPAITLKGESQGSSVYFEDKSPYDDLFSDNNTPYLSSEAVQTFYAFQRVMKAVDQKFGWKGPDGIGQKPVTIYMKDSDDTDPSDPETGAHYFYEPPLEYFEFFRATKTNNEPFNNVLEVVGHEYTHAILHQKTGINFDWPDLCKESPALSEGIADVLGMYLKNKILQIPPQNFDWEFKKQYNNPEHLGDPKSFGFPDTYYGQNYPSTCSMDFDVHPASGVLCKWFYLLVEGHQGTAYNDLNYPYSDLVGIDVEKAIQIVWDAIPAIKVYSDYAAFRVYTLQAAEKLYGLHSTEYLAVQNAWCAVGVCDNNPVGFSMYPANATSNVIPWPAVKINLTWPSVSNGAVKKWLVETSTKYDFSENVQTAETDNISMIVDPDGVLTNYATVNAFYHPGEKVYARAKITEADPNFCKGINPLCQFYQQFGPTHAFVLKEQKIEFWPNNNLSMVVNPWDKPELIWKSVDDAHRYGIQLATDNAFNNLVYDDFAVHTTNFTDKGEINTVLEAGKDYYARVRAERLDFIKINKNYGTWSDVVTLHTATPQTSILQALNQKANDPATPVSSLGFDVSWYAYAGASNYVIQAATDAAFLNIIRSQTVAGNLTTSSFLLPSVADLTNLFVRVIPQKGAAFGLCNNTWRIKADQQLAVPAMKSPVNGTVFPYHDFLATFEWTQGALNKNWVAQYQLEITKTASNLTAIFTTPDLDLLVKDPLLFDGNFQVRVCGINSLGAKSALSAPFNYTVCPDHPAVSFPGDLGKVDSDKNFNIEWYQSQSFAAGSQYLVTIVDAVTSVPVSGFNNKPTTNNFMLVPANTLTSGKSYLLTVKNSSSCPAINLPKTFFDAVGSGGSNEPPKPQLVDFAIDLKGFRNDPDGLAIGTSNYRLGIEMIDPDGNPLTLVDPNGNQITYLDVDSEDSGVILKGDDKPQGKYKLRLKMLEIFPPVTYYPFDQPFFSVSLNGKPIISKHVITIDFFDPASPFHEWQVGFQFQEIVLNVK